MQEQETGLAAAPCSAVLEGFVKLGEEYRQHHDLGDGFHKRVRGFFLKSLARAYWEPTRQYMATTSWPVAAACELAGVDPSTPTRWDRMVPDYTTICLLFARCDLDMRGVPFPRGHEAFRRAFFKTLEYIRAEELSQRQLASLDNERWECLRLGLGSQAVLDAVTVDDNPKSRSLKAKELRKNFRAAAETIATEMGRQFPAGSIKNAEGVEQTIGDWLIPWVLFYTVVPYVWKGQAL
jgi:hypothetical protein